MKKNNPLVFAITTGDQDGIGPEVSYKALRKLGPQKNCSFIIYRSHNVPQSLLRKVDTVFKKLAVSTLEEALALPRHQNVLIEVISQKLPPHWVEEAAKSAFHNQLSGLITAPLSKTLIHEAGLKERGHTEILQRVARSKPLTMAFWGPQLSVALGTIHLPLSKVAKALTSNVLEHHLRNIIHYFSQIKKNPLRIGVLGLNPHAGEAGLIGKEEQMIWKPTLKKLRRQFPQVYLSEPLVPDAAFLKKNHHLYDIYFCPYHDQGLIPFKLIHGQERGCQITLGLPFVRTSVDHGTAKDIFGKNRAHSGSMEDALIMALLLGKKCI